MLIRPVPAALIAASLAFLPAVQAQQSVTVPAGTVVPLTLVNPIKNKSTAPGDSIRAIVAFPITAGDQVAIPAGTYVEGTLSPPAPKVKHQPDPGVQIHFTRLVFANGYSAPLDAMQTAGSLPPSLPERNTSQPIMALLSGLNTFSAVSSIDFANLISLPSQWGSWRVWLMSPQIGQPTTPTQPTLPKVGPNVGLIIGLSVIAPVAVIVTALIHHSHSGRSDFIVHDAGWQFQMKLDAPLTLNPSLVGSKIP